MLAACIAVIDKELYGEGMRHETATHESTVGSIREHGFHLFLRCSIRDLVFLGYMTKTIAYSLLVHVLRLQDRSIARKQTLNRRVGIGQSRDDTFLLCLLLFGWTFIVVDTLDATIKCLALRQMLCEGTCRSQHAKQQKSYMSQFKVHRSFLSSKSLIFRRHVASSNITCYDGKHNVL